MGTNKQDRDVKLKKEMLKILGENNESVRQTFEQFDNKVGQGFKGVEIKFAAVFLALGKLGISPEKLQEIANGIQNPQGGDTDEQKQGEPPVAEGIKDSPNTGEQSASNENGDEHFG